MNEIYLDNSATTKPFACVPQVMTELMEQCYGNPSALHHMGFLAEKQMTQARQTIAGTLRCEPREIYFTSGGTESDNMAILGTVRALRRLGDHLVTTTVEHPAVLRCFEALEKDGFRVDYIPLLADGMPDLDFAKRVICDKTILVSCMLVNNELGSLFPVEKMKTLMTAAGSRGYLHTDCVQAYGKVPFTAKGLGADLITLSGHKIHGPKGVGALYVKKGVRILPPIFGGGQEQGLRSGTENTFAIAGFAAAANQTFADLPGHIGRLQQLSALCRQQLTERVEHCVFNTPAICAPHILNLSLPGLKSEVMLHFLESRGIYVSAGSACSAKSGKTSHTLLAAGLDRTLAESALRISFGAFNTPEDCASLAEGLAACRATLKGKA